MIAAPFLILALGAAITVGTLSMAALGRRNTNSFKAAKGSHHG